MTPKTPFGRRTVLKTLGSAVVAGGALTGVSAAGSDTVDLIAGQDTRVGSVRVDTRSGDRVGLSADYHTLHARERERTNWELTETHLAVGDSLREYEEKGWVGPQGQPRPGRFPYSNTDGSYRISLDSPSDGTYVIAAHAVVERTDTGEEETAWGHGRRFVERKGSWATYFEHTV